MPKNHVITMVSPNSIAEELEIFAGDKLISINNKKIVDVLDYRFMINTDFLTLEIEKSNGEIWQLEIEKDDDEDLGLTFKSGLMDTVKRCANNCPFCFVEQLPKGMRQALYFKDDDIRLSFLHGNYVTLSNLSQAEVKRIAKYHLSPLHISVHAAAANLRCQILGNKKASYLFDYLEIFRRAGITMHFQIVLCKGLNDGKILDETIQSLLQLQPNAASLSVVPVGLTKFRQNLPFLQPFSREESQAVIKQVQKWQSHAMEKYGTAFVFCADEWYIKAGFEKFPMPKYEHYEGFPQLENGVGMWAMFDCEFNLQNLEGSVDFANLSNLEDVKKFGVVTGEAAALLIKKKFPNNKIYVVKNQFFGETITVSGLLTATDVISQVKEKVHKDNCKGLFLPTNMFRENVTLDDVTKSELEEKLGLPICFLW
ncbi:MAG: DUF512 domain-containing protein [Firmicutes bacterium]|nr:DUF512 domain-containing protein [Bacillota bacterium]